MEVHEEETSWLLLLPSDIWSCILRMLDLCDRLNVSRAFPSSFRALHQSDSWRNLKLHFTCWEMLTDKHPKSDQLESIRQFGAFFSTLSISFSREMSTYSEVLILKEVSKHCHKLRTFNVIMPYNKYTDSGESTFELIATLREIASRNPPLNTMNLGLKRLLSEINEANLIRILTELFAPDGRIGGIVKKLDVFQSISRVPLISYVTQCANLRVLSCQIHFLTTKNLDELLRRTKLEELQVTNDDITSHMNWRESRDIDWTQLSRSHSVGRLKVRYIVKSRRFCGEHIVANPFMRSFMWFWTETPGFSNTLFQIVATYAASLASLVIYGSAPLAQVSPRELASALKMCNQFETLVLSRSVGASNLIELVINFKLKNLHVSNISPTENEHQYEHSFAFDHGHQFYVLAPVVPGVPVEINHPIFVLDDDDDDDQPFPFDLDQLLPH